MRARFQSPEGVVLTVQHGNGSAAIRLMSRFQSPEGVVLTVQQGGVGGILCADHKFQSPEGVVLTVQLLPVALASRNLLVSVPRRGSADGATRQNGLPLTALSTCFSPPKG